MSEVKWEEPETTASGRGGESKYAATVKLLKANPGRWAVIAEDASPTLAGYLKRKYGVEATTRGVKNNRAAKIYARWPEQD